MDRYIPTLQRRKLKQTSTNALYGPASKVQIKVKYIFTDFFEELILL